MALYASGVHAEAAESREQALASYGGEQVEVFVATRDIAVGETLSADNVSRQLWLSDLLPLGALGTSDEVFGQVVAVGLLRNEPVVAAKLGLVAAPVSIPEGYCAVTIPTDDVLAVGGAISAGSVVMIYAAGPQTVELLAEEVLILATSNGAQAEDTSGGGLFASSSGSARVALSWVTLAVEPHRVQELIAASRDKSLYLVLPGAGIGIEDLEVGDFDEADELGGPDGLDGPNGVDGLDGLGGVDGPNGVDGLASDSAETPEALARGRVDEVPSVNEDGVGDE
jgi:pilus assembly protein CpaB